MTFDASTQSAVFIQKLVSEIISSNNSIKWYQVVESLLVGFGTFFIGIGALLTAFFTGAPWLDKKRLELKINQKTKLYKDKYPVENFEETYNLVWFKGNLYLFDLEDKKYYHIRPWETAENLNFTSLGKHIDYASLPDPKKNPVIELGEDKKFDIKDYKNGGDINTQI